ncbi:hypothetical protein, partial [uncultured Alistipes sp.]|uniref:hypothetical protein n=1 Tax=uncultured Alistipes sp. TaxID=538949 RepID=UPI0025852B6E
YNYNIRVHPITFPGERQQKSTSYDRFHAVPFYVVQNQRHGKHAPLLEITSTFFAGDFYFPVCRYEAVIKAGSRQILD